MPFSLDVTNHQDVCCDFFNCVSVVFIEYKNDAILLNRLDLQRVVLLGVLRGPNRTAPRSCYTELRLGTACHAPGTETVTLIVTHAPPPSSSHLANYALSQRPSTTKSNVFQPHKTRRTWRILRTIGRRPRTTRLSHQCQTFSHRKLNYICLTAIDYLLFTASKYPINLISRHMRPNL